MSSILKITSSIIIPTYNRPNDLDRCILSILNQTIKPTEIIIVDDGDLKDLPRKKECESAGIHYVYLKKRKKGVCASRNLAAKIAKGRILFLLDDDVILFPNYVEEILKTYIEYPSSKVGGVGGIIENARRPLNPLKLLYELVFLLSGFREGKVLVSGFATNFGQGLRTRKVSQVEFLDGGVSSYKKEIFDEFQFDERYQDTRGYAKTEDKDFSYRVSRKYILLLNPAARLYHFPSPGEKREDLFRSGYEFIMGRYRFFKHHKYRTPVHGVFWVWACFGYLLKHTILALFSSRPNEIKRVKGILKAFSDIFFGLGLAGEE